MANLAVMVGLSGETFGWSGGSLQGRRGHPLYTGRALKPRKVVCLCEYGGATRSPCSSVGFRKVTVLNEQQIGGIYRIRTAQK